MKDFCLRCVLGQYERESGARFLLKSCSIYKADFTLYSPRAMFNGGLDGATVNQAEVVVTSPSGAKLIDYSPQRGGAVDGTSNDAQKYVFDSGQATQFANTVSPEFFFTRGTLWEALATVGGYIHGMPRLVYDDGGRTVIRRRSCLPQ